MIPAFPDRGADAEARLSRKPTVEDPDDVVLWDGLKQHISLEWLRASRAKRVRTGVRYSHGSQDNQHEDFETFAYFKPAFAGEKMKLRTDKIEALSKPLPGETQPRMPTRQERIAAGKLTDGDVLRCAKGPWEEALSKERTAKGWAREGIIPQFNRALYWRLKAEEDQQEAAVATRPAVRPDEEWLKQFGAPHSSAASIDCDPKKMDEEVIEAEAEQRFQARLASGAAPEKLPAVNAGNVFKLPGSASGELAVHVVVEKEIERRVEQKLKDHRQVGRDSKAADKVLIDLANANDGLDLYLESGIGALTVKHLEGILRTHERKPKGKKDALQQQILDLLNDKTPDGASPATIAAEMKRLTNAAAATAQLNDRPLALTCTEGTTTQEDGA
eukprot:7387952-Prymnesium_polylepis.1